MSPKTPLNDKLDARKKLDSTQKIFGVRINGTQKSRVLTKIGLQRKEMLHVVTVNSEFLMEARQNIEFRNVLSQCQVSVADGWGVVWATQILANGWGKVERISGEGLVHEILRKANERREKVFLLGAEEGIAEKAAIAMAKRYPRVEYAWYEGAKRVKVEKREEASMTIAKVNAFEPDYLLVAYLSPWADVWIEENRPYLRVRVAMGVGGVLDEWAGKTRRCPEWLDRRGGKWLWRLIQEPWRWRRIVRVLQFGLLVVLSKVGVIRDISN
ncbi:MAG: WecB/TagA/CpsF family glycosyltransferase [bacterium]